MSIILFGIRSPLCVDYEETCARSGIEIAASVNINGTPRVMDVSKVIEFVEYVQKPLDIPFIVCAFSQKRRRELFELGLQNNLKPAKALIDPTAIVARSARIGDCSFINAGAIIGAVSHIGRGVLINRAVSIGHHTVVGDFVSIGPGATLAGNIAVGDDTLIGAGAVVLPNVRIGERAIIAAGSVVRKHVGEGCFVAGNPAIVQRFAPSRIPRVAEDDE